MPYTADEIINIHLLAQDADFKNVLLAFELIRGRGIVPALLTDIYWIYNRAIWSKQTATADAVYTFFQEYWTAYTPLKKLSPLLTKTSFFKPALHPSFEAEANLLGLNLPLLAKLLHQQFPIDQSPINGFLFKYGTENMQIEILPFLKKREHTGRFLLDLGGFNLQQLPATVFTEKQIQVLNIWGNNLQTLPDFWDQLPLLETLNIAENKLQQLPPSFVKLQKLKKLYAQNNTFIVSELLSAIKQLSNIQYLAISTPQEINTPYTLTENKKLNQFEQLVNHGKLHVSEKEQNLFLALFMKKKGAVKELTLKDLFQALSDPNETIRVRAKEQILNWKGRLFNGTIPSNSSVAILGIVSFATRNKLNAPTTKNTRYSTEINSSTTHIVLGDYPENYDAIEDRPFIFITENDL